METNKLIKLLLQEESKELTISEATTIFFNKLKIHNRPGTYHYYKSALKPILKYINISNINSTQLIDKNVINKYMMSRIGTVKNTTINKEIKALSTMLNYLHEQELISNINFKYKPLPQEEPNVKNINSKDIEKILNYFKTSKTSDINKLAFMLILTTGIRTNELLNIKNSNIDLINKKIYLDFTKTHKPRYIYIVEEIEPLLKKCKTSDIYLFNISCNRLRLFFKKIKKCLNIEVLSPHKLRHYYRTYIYNKSLDIYMVSKLLGHQEIKTTQIYLSIDSKHNQEMNNKYNPIKELLTH